MTTASREPAALLALGLLALAVSGVSPYDRFTWFLEVAPVLVAVPILVATRRTFPLTPLAYRLIFVHALILILGGHHTYARVPAGFLVQRLFELPRNPYDGLGHLAQGFIPAILAREVLLRKLWGNPFGVSPDPFRKTPLARGGWLFFLVTSVCLAISALYELIEWAAAAGTGSAADDFLGTQGDVWDTQKDMLLALVGAMAALLLLSRRHDRELREMEVGP